MIIYVVTALLFSISFVVVTDPYCLFGPYNVDKRLPFYTWCHYNFLKKFKKIDIGLVGSSAINYYSSSYFERRQKTPFFMGVESSNIYEHLRYGRLLLNKQPDELYFFYTFYSLNPSRANQPEFLEKMVMSNSLVIDFIYQYLNLRALMDSFIFWYKKVFGWNTKYQLFHHNGLRTQAHYLNRENYCFDKTIGDYFSAMSIDPHYYASKTFQNSDSILPGIEAIRAFKRDVEKQGIKMHFTSTPLYRLTIALIYESGLGETYENFRRKMAEIGPFVDLNLDLEFTSNPENWWDSHHARRGENVIDQVAAKEFLVDESNVEQTMKIVRPTEQERQQVRDILNNYPGWDDMNALIGDRIRKTPPLVP